MKRTSLPSLLTLLLCCAAPLLQAQPPLAPDWAQPGSATHTQVPPPADFRRASTLIKAPLGVFDGQADVGSALLPGSASFDAKSGTYTINSAGYNIWYFRDEFRYLWKKMSGDVSLASDISFPNPAGYDDRKVVLIIRQDLDDDSKEVMVGLHGAGLIHLAQRPDKHADIKETCRMDGGKKAPGDKPLRLGIEKQGDTFALFVSLNGEPMHQVGTTTTLHLDTPFYVGVGFCSHLPVTSDTGVLSKLVLENAAGKVH